MSPLAHVLEAFFKESKFSPVEWARFLGVTGGGIQDWFTDRAIPRGDLLRMIVDLAQLQEQSTAIFLFKSLEHLPAEAISPIGKLMRTRTLAEYLASSSVVSFGQRLRELDEDEQMYVLQHGGWTK